VTSDLAVIPLFIASLSQQRKYAHGNRGKGAPRPRIGRKSHVFKILTFKVFVMKILRRISLVKVAKSLIPDILEKEGGGGVG
jgi:hypothetical protein